MFDARNFIQDLEPAKKILEAQGAVLKGHYVIHDCIYKATDGTLIDSVFLRLRLVPVNIWNEKAVIVAIKNTQKKEVGKVSVIPLKKEFDTKEEAEVFIQQNYASQFTFDFEFDREGWQYDLGEDQVDLENIEGHCSIEFKSKTEEGLRKLLDLFNAEDLIRGPSVVAIKKILGR